VADSVRLMYDQSIGVVSFVYMVVLTIDEYCAYTVSVICMHHAPVSTADC